LGKCARFERRRMESLGGTWPDRHGPWNLSGKPTPPEPEQYGDFAVATGVLGRMGVAPDFESDAPLRYTHRRDGRTDIYFVANPKDCDVKAACAFRVSSRQPQLWDPVTGATHVLGESRQQDGQTIVPLEFAPGQSWFVVFKSAAGDQRSEIKTKNWREFKPVQEITGPWEVSFDPMWGGPAHATFEKLEDWTTRSEPGIRYYSGTATYRKPLTFRLSNPNPPLPIGSFSISAA